MTLETPIEEMPKEEPLTEGDAVTAQAAAEKARADAAEQRLGEIVPKLAAVAPLVRLPADHDPAVVVEQAQALLRAQRQEIDALLAERDALRRQVADLKAMLANPGGAVALRARRDKLQAELDAVQAKLTALEV